MEAATIEHAMSLNPAEPRREACPDCGAPVVKLPNRVLRLDARELDGDAMGPVVALDARGLARATTMPGDRGLGEALHRPHRCG